MRALQILAGVLFFSKFYLPGTDLPVYSGDLYAAHPIRAAHGVTITTPEWARCSLSHTFTTRWVDYRPHVGAIDYEVSLRVRASDQLSFNLTHGSIHNVDAYAGPVRRQHWLGFEWRMP